ncbi:MAG: menaquinone biosynthesis protein [bacterium]
MDFGFKMLKLGHINYLNCIPVHGAIIMKKVPFKGELVYGTPNLLNKLLEAGEIDISPSSSAELIKGYKVIPDFSISGKTDVKSIILVTKRPLEDIKRGLFYVTSHSATSALLLKVILKEFYQIEAKYRVFAPEKHTLLELINKSDGVLYIGDFALKLKCSLPYYKNDLAEIWYKKTSLPFTFAVWQLRRSFEYEEKKIKYLYYTLKASFEYFRKDPSRLAEQFHEQFSMSVDEILKYWESLSFELKDVHLKSLKLYFSLAKRQGLISKEPEIELVSLP